MYRYFLILRPRFRFKVSTAVQLPVHPLWCRGGRPCCCCCCCWLNFRAKKDIIATGMIFFEVLYRIMLVNENMNKILCSRNLQLFLPGSVKVSLSSSNMSCKPCLTFKIFEFIADLQVFIQQGAVHYPTRWRAQKLDPMLHMLGDLFVVTSNLILMVGNTPNMTSPPMDWPTVWFCAWGLVVWNPIESSYERDNHELGYRYPCSKTANPICRWLDFDSCMNILTMETFDILFESVHIPLTIGLEI